MFSVVYGLLLNPFPYAADRLVQIEMQTTAAPQPLAATARQWVELRQSEVLEDAIVLDGWPMTLTGADLPEAVPTQYYSANAFTMLGLRPLLGRLFTEADGPAGQVPQKVVVLTYRFWRRHFAGQPDAIGQTLRLNRDLYTVIGVLQPQYFDSGPEIIVPVHLTFDPNFSWMVQARLKPGVSLRQAEDRLQPLVARFAQESPARFPKDF